MNIIEAQNLNKTFRIFDRRPGVMGAVKDLFSRRYRNLEAVKDLSFSIPEGELVGYIGPNGAGKSTTIKMLTGILHPTSGTITVNGFVPFAERRKYLQNVGVVFGQRSQLWWDLAVQESFRLLQRIYNVSENDFDRRMKQFDETLSINQYLRTPVRKLSLGQKMRCEIAASLLHSPRLLFLDEPTIGLDVVAKIAIRDFLKKINREEGTTIILTTHDLKDIEKLCKRVIIIDKGSKIHDGTLESLRNQLTDEATLSFVLSNVPEASAVETHLESLPVKWNAEDGNLLKAVFNPQDIRRAEVIRRVLEHFDVHDITMEETDIDKIIQRIYERADSHD